MTNLQTDEFDAVVIGAGFAGLYMLHRLREAGFSTRVYDAAEDVGGVWYWNRYPGARCDVESIYYNYSFSEELFKEWTWTSKFPEQPEILRYLNYVADKFDLRRDIQFNTKVRAAHYDEIMKKWKIHMADGTSVTANYFITGVGCISSSNIPNFKGLDSFEGDWYHTGHWPKDKVDFKGKRVGVVGTGSSGIQAIPVIAKEADHLTVFQRTPQYTVPARNHPYNEKFIQEVKDNFPKIKHTMRHSSSGNNVQPRSKTVLSDPPEVRQKVFEDAWQEGGYAFVSTYYDYILNEEANEVLAEFIRSKINGTVHDKELAEKLLPKYYFGTKRPVLDTNYYETYNRENVDLADVKEKPIIEFTINGIKTTEKEYKLDTVVFATGYDGMTGSLFKIDIRGKNGVSLKEKWDDGAAVKTFLGLATSGFPNFFMITGPESPSVLTNMPPAIEQHVEWITDCMKFNRDKEIDTIEATRDAEEEWSKHCQEIANQTLYVKTDSWYTGANIEGKPRNFLIYLGGFDVYTKKCDEIAEAAYKGFTLSSLKTMN